MNISYEVLKKKGQNYSEGKIRALIPEIIINENESYSLGAFLFIYLFLC